MEGFLKCRDEVKLYYKKDIPEGAIANIIINHGFAEHLDRYDYVTRTLNIAKIGVYRYDLRGHGRTQSPKGQIDDFMQFVSDADGVVDLAKKEYPDLPLFMLGHSMGGFITCLYGISKPDRLQGQIFSGAAVRRLPIAKGIKGDLFKLLNVFVPNMKIKNVLSEDTCSVQQVVEDYKDDPLVLKESTLNFHVQFVIKGTDWIRKNIKRYNYPCLITHGENDKIVPKEASIYLYNSISSKDKEIKIYDDLYHEILNEREKDKILTDIINWLYKRI
ncbi:lysophospholipase [Schnuerera sp. xch1]|uniref:alpha/beta hydrolase n=1 Tax=Schnuerera sp. xch1 TaxID=2874283 RepID=UPI001CBD3381|nr:alpha/beta hydrolase [Schnuerera sp. xch1]MBZ2174496.1 lysophospholipase [Schnuerera sp. xch1]